MDQIRVGIRVWLLGLAALAALPLFLFSAYLIFQFRNLHQENADRELIQRTTVAANAVSQRLNAALGYLNVLAASDAAQTNDLRSLYEQARRVSKNSPELSAISLVAPDNEMEFSTLRPFGRNGATASDPAAVSYVFQTGQPMISGPFKSQVTGAIVAALGVPVFQNGNVAYCLRMVVRTDSLNQLLIGQKLPDDWRIAIVDKSGLLVASARQPENYVGKMATPSLLNALRTNSEGVFDSVNREGTEVRTVINKVPGWDWTVVVGAPTDLLSANVKSAIYFLISLGIILAATGFFISVWLAKKIAKYLSAVAEASAALHRGEHMDVPRVPIVEIDDMVQQLSAVTKREQRTNMALLNVTASHEAVTNELDSARRDALTGLPGRALFLEMVEGLRQSVASHGHGRLAFLFIDLDGFKEVNDTLGHAQGDKVLIQAAEVLREMTRDSDVAGRVGGDEFVVCLTAADDQIDPSAQGVAGRIVERIGRVGLGISCSIGISVWSDHCPDVFCAMRCADEAMYEAKRNGKGCYVVFGALPKSDGSAWTAIPSEQYDVVGPI